MNAPLLEARGIELRAGDRRLCHDLNWRLEAGQRHALLGANGAGKTTLLHTLAGLRAPDAGQAALQGRCLTRLSRREIARSVGVLFQDADGGFPGTVLETALQGRHPHRDGWGWETREDRAIALEALERMELTDLRDRDVRSLSGGERQRLALAVLLTQQPRIALLDEPANHLDPGGQIRLLDRVLAFAQSRNAALVMSLHDPNLALRFCDQALLLFAGGDWLAGPADAVITAAHLERLYGHPMKAVGRGRDMAFVAR